MDYFNKIKHNFKWIKIYLSNIIFFLLYYINFYTNTFYMHKKYRILATTKYYKTTRL